MELAIKIIEKEIERRQILLEVDSYVLPNKFLSKANKELIELKDSVKKMSVMRCCKSDSELLASKEKQKNMIIKMMRKDEESGMYSDNES